MSEPWVLGIDFGTSYTVAAIRVGDRAAEVLEIDGDRRIPSVVYVDDDGSLVVGRDAEHLAATRPARAVRAPKRLLGDPAPVVIDGIPHSVTDLVGAILAHVLADAVRYCGSQPSVIRLTHPVTWRSPRLGALVAAAEVAGITNAELVAEPVAAALAYADVHPPQVGAHVVVYDLGGGTFDAAVLQATPDGFDVVGRPLGEDRLGGELFDELVMHEIGAALDPDTWQAVLASDELRWRQASNALRVEARRVKEALSTRPYAETVLALPGTMFEHRMERAELETLIQPHIEATVDLLSLALADAAIDPGALTSVYLAGGASRSPLVEEVVRSVLPGVEVARRGDPKTVVALGAATSRGLPSTAVALPQHNTASADSSDAAGTGVGRLGGEWRSTKLLAIGAVAALLVSVGILAVIMSARGGRSDVEASGPTTAVDSTASQPGADEPVAGNDARDAAPVENVGAQMQVTVDLHPDAVWDDGQPITYRDFECYRAAAVNTPGSVVSDGYRLMEPIEAGVSDRQVVITMRGVYADYKRLFGGLFPAHIVSDCSDISEDLVNFAGSGREWRLESWSQTEAVLVPNDTYWNAAKTPRSAKVVMMPVPEDAAQVGGLLDGSLDFIFPEVRAGLVDDLASPDVLTQVANGAVVEAVVFQQRSGPLEDLALRTGLQRSIDRDLVNAQVHAAYVPDAPLLECGVWVPNIGDWCDENLFVSSLDVDAATAALTDGGWSRNVDGFWERDGDVPTLQWVVDSTDTRRVDIARLLLDSLAGYGFKVVIDEVADGETFQARLDALDYDIAIEYGSVGPEPSVTGFLSCDAIPTADQAGANTIGWCNELATMRMKESDKTVDEGTRVALIHEIGLLLRDDSVLLPLFQIPRIAAWNTTRVVGPVGENVENVRGFGHNLWAWEPVFDESIVIGAAGWPACLNPVICDSDWFRWSVWSLVAPGVWDLTATGGYEPTDLVVGEPIVSVGG